MAILNIGIKTFFKPTYRFLVIFVLTISKIHKMATLTIKIPDGKALDVSKYVKNIGGEVVNPKKATTETEDDDEVTHGVFFGENINRVIKAFKTH